MIRSCTKLIRRSQGYKNKDVNMSLIWDLENITCRQSKKIIICLDLICIDINIDGGIDTGLPSLLLIVAALIDASESTSDGSQLRWLVFK